MNKITVTILLALPFVLVGCVSKRSEVATAFGYDNSSKIEAGPYQLHYGRSGSDDELVLLAEGNWNILSRETGQGTAVYLDGVPFISFDRNHEGSLTNLTLNVLDLHGNRRVFMIDREVDGQWDIKSDFVLRKVFDWIDGRWVERRQSQQQSDSPNDSPATPVDSSDAPVRDPHR